MFNAMTSEINEDVLRFLVRTKFRIEIKTTDDTKNLATNQGADTSAPKQPVINARKELSRNDLCWCGSGKKYKYCHGR